MPAACPGGTCPPSMSKILKPLLLFTFVTFVIWVAVLWHWEATRRDMTVPDIVIYLGVLPLVVIGLLLALRWAWSAAAKSTAAGTSASAAAAAGTSASSQEEQRRHSTVKVLSAHVHCPTGEAASEMLEAAQAGKPRPGLDEELRGDDGLPVMCARIAAIDTAEVDTLLEPVLAAVRKRKDAWADARVPSHVLRALGAMRQPLGQALADLEPWARRLGAPPQDAATGADAAGSAGPAAMVRAVVGWPADWSEFEQALALGWVRWLITEDGATSIPASRFVFDAHACTGEELWLKADQLLQVLARETREDVVLLAACHSSIGEEAVAALAQQQRLFSAAQHPKGLMPGEAAAALVLAPPQWPAAPDEAQPPVQLHRPAVQRRDKSIEAGGRVSPDCLRDTLVQALSAGRLDAAAVGALVCDADQHTPRSTELFGTTLELLPHLDPTEDMRLIGVGTGHTGVASALLVVAAAAERARAAGLPTVALTLGDAFMRLALLVRPHAASPT